jgi:hypothetical protein
MNLADRLLKREAGDKLWTTLMLAILVVTAPAASAQGRGGAPPGAQGPGQDGGGGRGGNAVATPAGPVRRMPDGKPDLTGVWDGSGGRLTHTAVLEDHPGGFGIQAGKTLIVDPPDGVIPYQPAALKERDRRREDGNGYEDLPGHCEMYDIGRIHSFPQEIAYSGNQVVIHAFQHITRVIDMARKEHLPAGIRLYDGDPIGRWEGDTLVVDSTNFNGKTRMAIGGDFYSANAHIVERFMPLDSNTIRWTMTIEDPTIFTRPWTMTSAALMTRQRETRNFDEEDTCHEGNLDLVHLKNVYEQFNGTTKWPPER